MICEIVSYAKENPANPNKITSILLNIDGNKLLVSIDDSQVTETDMINYCISQAQAFAQRNYDAVSLDDQIGVNLTP